MPRYNLHTTTSYRVLIFDLFLFLLLSGIIWAINVIGQSSFPGNNLIPVLIRSTILTCLLTFSYYTNNKFIKKNVLNGGILKLRFTDIKQYFGGIVLGCLLVVTIWIISYLIYPFEVIQNPDSTVNPVIDIISYSLGNTLEELLFRGFLLLAFIKLFGKTGGVLLVSLLFGLFHLQGLGLTGESLSMVMTTFSMSLLFISVIYFTKSIWAAALLHITGNFLLHTLGFDGANKGMFQIRFSTSNINGHLITLIYEIVVITFALVIFIKGKKQI